MAEITFLVFRKDSQRTHTHFLLPATLLSPTAFVISMLIIKVKNFSKWENKKLNSRNDLLVIWDDFIWFTVDKIRKEYIRSPQQTPCISNQFLRRLHFLFLNISILFKHASIKFQTNFEFKRKPPVVLFCPL